MRKKSGSLILLALVILLLMPFEVFAQDDLSIVLNGKKLESDVSPYIKNERTMVPVRFIVEALGGSAELMINPGFPKKYQKFISVIDQRYIDAVGLDLFINEKVCLSGEAAYKSDVAPEIVNGRTMVSLRFIADYLRFNVKWDNNTRTVFLNEMSREDISNSNKDYFHNWYYEKGSEAVAKCIEDGFTERNLNKVFN